MSAIKTTFKKHFRKNHSKKSHGHPAFVYGRKKDEYKYLGLTHAPITHGKRNVRLRANPNPHDHKTSYVRPFARTDKIKFFSKKKLRGWKISKKIDAAYVELNELKNNKSGRWTEFNRTSSLPL